MKKIAKFEEIIRKTYANEKLSPEEATFNGTLYWAYRKSAKLDLDTIDFGDVFWEKDAEEIITTLREEGFETFTISSTFSGLLDIIWEFESLGCKMEGLKKVRQPYDNFNEDTMENEPAYKPAVIIRL